MEKEFELIVTVVEKGHSDEIIVASREAGAQGGTIIYGRGTNPKENKSILGMNVTGEKEVVFIIVEKDKKKDVMENISDKAKLNTTGKGLCFSLPIDNFLGAKHDSNFQKFDNMPQPTSDLPKQSI